MKIIAKLLPLFCLVLVCGGFLQSCVPVFSEIQSARTVGKNKVELTPSGTIASESQAHVGLQLAYGISDKIDIRARFERVWITDNQVDLGASVIGIGGKFSLLQDRISLYLPIGRAIGEGSSDTWQFQPTLLLTQPIVKEKVEATLTPKYLLLFCEDCENLFATNLGLALSSDVTRWAIRPEYGMLFSSEGTYHQFSLGFSATIGK